MTLFQSQKMTFKSHKLLSMCGKGAEQYSDEQAWMLLVSYLDAIWEMLLHPRGLLEAHTNCPGAG